MAQLKRNLLLTTLMIAAAILPLGWFGARTLTRPLATVTEAMSRIAQRVEGLSERDGADPGVRGLLPAAVLTRRDELGMLGRGFSTLMEQLAQARAKLIERSEAELGIRSRQLDAALENMSQGLCMFDEERRLVVHNRRFMEIFGLAQDAITPRMHIRDLLRACEDAGNYPDGRVAAIEVSLSEQLASGQPAVSLEPLRGGRIVSIVRVPMSAGGWVTTFEDITERRRAEAQIEHMAHHDALTGLPNRVMFHRELERAVSATSSGKQVAVLCLDLDRFKAVNDTLGHPIGDELLRAVAGRLQGCLRSTAMVARLGGDEFAVIDRDVSSTAEPTRLAARIIEALSAPFQVGEHQIAIGTSIGASLAPLNGLSSDDLVKAADMALYTAKANGRGTFRFFEPEMDAHMQQRRALELDLRRALANGEFELHYQPLVNLETGRVSCFEALLRWRDASRGWVSPGDFIPLAEEIGLIDQIGRWVLQEACCAAKEWPGEVRVAVNLSPAQFRSAALVWEVEAALDSSGLAPTRLELEITEGVLLQHTERTLSILNQLRALGVRISMDDFGTGYSSLSYLRSFSFDKIKIDRSFISGLGEGDESLAIVRAVSGLGVSLGMTTTAEGVETLDQLEQLRQESCTEVQGYYFSPAVPAADLPALLAKIGSAARTASAA